MRDDRLSPVVYFVFVPLLLLTAIFGPALVIFARSTSLFWAWEIKPAMSAVWIGAAYTFGSIAIMRMLAARSWRQATVPVIGTWLFSLVVAAATFIHWDRFFLNTINFYVWLAIYLLLPVLLPVIWWLNRGRDPGPRPDDLLLPEPLRWGASAAGGLIALIGLIFIFTPANAALFWPWQLTPLVSRNIGAWLLFISAGLLCMLFERRYRAYRPYLLPVALWFAILFASTFFYLDNFSIGRPATWVWLAVTGGTSLLALASYLYLEARARSARVPRTPLSKHDPAN